MNKEFIKWFKETSLYIDLLERFSPELILLCGSRSSGYFTDHSDYDVVLYTQKSTQEYYHPVKLNYNNCTVHVMIVNIHHYLQLIKNSLNCIDNFYLFCGIGSLCNNKNIIYNNDIGIKLLQFFQNYGKDLISIAIAGLCRNLQYDLHEIVSTKNFIPFENKRYFHLVLAYHVLFPQEDVFALLNELRLKPSYKIEVKYHQQLSSIATKLLSFYQKSNIDHEFLILTQLELLLQEIKK